MGLFGRLFGKKTAAETPAPVAKPAPAPAPVEKPAPVPVAAPAPVETPAPAPVETPAPVAEPVPAEASPVAGGKPYKTMRYNRSFTAKLIQTDDTVKHYYAEIEQELCSYAAKRRVSWRYEAFRIHRELLVKIVFRRKMLCLYFALTPEDYEGTKFRVERAKDMKAFEDTPCLLRIINKRRCKYAKELIADVMEKYGVARKKQAPPVSIPRYESTPILIARGLIREVGSTLAPTQIVHTVHEVSVAEANAALADETAEIFVEQASRYADKTKQGIINIDTLAAYFKGGEYVTLEEIRKRIKGYEKVTYIKVLARGKLDEPLTVEADEFSIEAVKMIVLTGGTVLRTRR